jgi:mRNA-degrading endonuclease toxin of MazEF toxin-antitoxin module
MRWNATLLPSHANPVDIPAPKPAQVIRYTYQWADEHAAGREEGRKDRPAAIVMTIQPSPNQLRVVVVPITHTPPCSASSALEIPTDLKRYLGLDDQRSWVVVDELNMFNWPGPDLRTTSPNSDSPLYGMLPSGFFRRVRDALVANIRAGKTRQVPRTE